MTESPLVDSSFVVPVFSLGDDPITYLIKAMAFLTVVASSRYPSTNNQLRTFSNSRNQATIQDDRVTVQQVLGRQRQSYYGTGYKSNASSSGGNNASGQAMVVKCYNCQCEGHMARQCTQPKRTKNAAWYKEKAMLAEAQKVGKILDEEQLAFHADPRAKAVLMANISNYGSDVISEDFGKRFVPQQEVSANETLWYHMLSPSTKSSDALPVKIEAPKELPMASLVNESLKKLKLHLANFDKVVKLRTTFNARTGGEWRFEHTKAVFNNEIISFLKPLKDIFNVFDRDILNEIMEVQTIFDQMDVVDFGKRFVPQQEVSANETLWYHMLSPSTKSSDALPVKIEAPKELPMASLVNESLKKLKLHLANFDKVVKLRTTFNARTGGEWRFEHTKAVFNNEIISFLKPLKDIFNVFDRDILNEIMEVQTIFDQMDVVVQQSSVDKQCLENAKKDLFLENDRLLHKIMSQDVLLTMMNSMSLIDESVNVERKRNESCDKYFNLEAELLKSQNAHNDLLKMCSQLKKHCISLESTIQLNQEIFQKDESCDNQNAFKILEF
nr:hypothetical protein [Tanacetum cinerariifolium]